MVDASECSVCYRSFNNVTPVAIKTCGHTFCDKCIPNLKVLTAQGPVLRCAYCRQDSPYRIRILAGEIEPWFENKELQEFMADPTIPGKCRECNELYGELKKPVFLASYDRFNSCGHCVCSDCFTMMTIDGNLFCRKCVRRISLPLPTPVINFTFMNSMAQNPIANPVQRNIDVEQDLLQQFKRLMRALYKFSHWLESEVIQPNRNSRLLSRMVERLQHYHLTGRFSVQDRTLILNQFPELVLYERAKRHTQTAMDMAETLLQDQVAIDPYLSYQINPYVPPLM